MRQAVRSVCLAFLCAHWALAAVAVYVSPSSVSVRVGASRPFAAAVRGTTNSLVTWKVNGVTGGNSTIGTVTSAGIYTAPVSVPSQSKVTVSATSAAESTVVASASVQLLNPVPTITSFEPTAVNTGKFSVTVRGTGFLESSTATFDGAAVPVTFISPTELRISAATSKQSVSLRIVVQNPDPGSAESNARPLQVMPPVTVSVSPSVVKLRAGDKISFKATVRNTIEKEITWLVNGVAGGTKDTGTIDEEGNYSAPSSLAAPKAVIIFARSNSAPGSIGTASVALLNGIPEISAITPASVAPGKATLTITGSGFAVGAKVLVGGQVLLSSRLVSSTEITATAIVTPVPGGVIGVQVSNPDPGAATSASAAIHIEAANPKMSHGDAVKFLGRATWGATPASIAHLQDAGYDAFLNEEFAAPPTIIPDRPEAEASYLPIHRLFFMNAFTQPDQLRQRTAYALSQLFVVSGVRLTNVQRFYRFFQMLEEKAFGNYRDLMEAVTLSTAMGEYLDMVNNEKGSAKLGTSPNENYARELLQLFSVGVFRLNPDGSVVRDSSNDPVPAYSEETIKEFARVFTGWTFPPKAGSSSKWRNPANYDGLMDAVESSHDTESKTLLNGTILPAGNTAREDLKAALDNIFNHANVGPFVAERLIKNFVTSNPSRAYVGRVAKVFNDNGSGVRGDLKAVVRAILLDPESLSSSQKNEHLRDPILFSIALLRALDTVPAAEHSLTAHAELMGLKLFFPSSVFSYYSPLYQIPDSSFAGPEFQIYTPSIAINRMNFVWSFLTNGVVGASFEIAPWRALADSPEVLVSAIENVFFHGEMTGQARASILQVINSTKDTLERARLALYLGATSTQFQVSQ